MTWIMIVLCHLIWSNSGVEGIHHFHNKASPLYCNSSHCVFSVNKFGAVGDGSKDSTAAFRNAWKEACAVKSAVVLVPSRQTFKITSTTFSGPCQPGLVFQVDGILMPPDGPNSWPKADSRTKWLVFKQLNHITLTGSGTIEGNGRKWWDLPCKPHKGSNRSQLAGSCDSPVLLSFYTSSNIVVRGLRFQNSPQFHLKFDGCEAVHVEKLSISSPQLSPNTDGIHIGKTKSVGIYDSVIGTGDDCISIGSGCAHVYISGLTCGPSHGISIGSLGDHNSEACVYNITVHGAIIRDSDNGVRIKTWQGGRGCASAILFENIHMDNVLNSVIVDQYYCQSKPCGNQTSAVAVTNVTYKNITGTYNPEKAPIHFDCSDNLPCTNITVTGVQLHPHAREKQPKEPRCWKVHGTWKNTVPSLDKCLRGGEPHVTQCTCRVN